MKSISKLFSLGAIIMVAFFVGGFFVAAPNAFAIVDITVTAQNFNTHRGLDYYGVATGFNLSGSGLANLASVKVELYAGDTLLVTNTFKGDYLVTLKAGGNFSSAFMTKTGTRTGSTSQDLGTWTPAPTVGNPPTRVVFTVTDSLDNTYTAENTSFQASDPTWASLFTSLSVYQTTLGSPSGTPQGNVFLPGSDVPFLAARASAIAGTLTSRTSYLPTEASLWGSSGQYGGQLYIISVVKDIPVGSLVEIDKGNYIKYAGDSDFTIFPFNWKWYFSMTQYTHTTSSSAFGYLTKFDCGATSCVLTTFLALADDYSLGADVGGSNSPPDLSSTIGFQVKQTIGVKIITGNWGLSNPQTHPRGYTWGTAYTGGDTPIDLGTLTNTSTVSQPMTVYVDDNYTYTPNSCSSQTCDGIAFETVAFTTIQAGINAVAVGGTVNVAAGTYNEQITINKNLTLSGSTGAIIQAPAVMVADANNMKSIVTVDGPTTNAEIRNLTIVGPGPSGCGSINGGIFVSGGATVNIHDNLINDIRDSTFSGCQNGQAIWVGKKLRYEGGTDINQVGTATITNNIITNYQKGGIVVDNIGSNATIIGNTITGVGVTTLIGQNGIQISRGATGTVTGNIVSGNVYTGGADACAGDGSTGDKATFYNNCWTSTGLLLWGHGVGVTASGNTINNNQVGVDVSGANSAVLNNNTIIDGKLYDVHADVVSVDATKNWWGTAVGTEIAAKISGIVNYSPWFTTIGMTQLQYTTTSVDGNLTATIPTEITVTGSSEGVTVTVVIPAGTVITGNSTWDGIINPPTATTSTVTIPGYTTTVTSAITIGSSLSNLTFDKAVKLTFAGQAGKLIGWYNHANVFTEITACASATNTEEAQTASLGAGASCKINVNLDLVVWTKHFSTFTTYTQTITPRGGGGGGYRGPSPVAFTTPAKQALEKAPGLNKVPGTVLGATAFSFTRGLKLGFRNNDVKELQQRLALEGVYTGPVTGYYGKLTKAAVKALQAKYKLTQDGVFGPKTRAALNQ